MKESNALRVIKTAEDYRQQSLTTQQSLSLRLVDMCLEFGWANGEYILPWLRERLELAQSIKPIPPINDMSRDEARFKLSMMCRGQVININGWKIRFNDLGFFIASDEKNNVIAKTPSLRGLLEVLFD